MKSPLKSLIRLHIPLGSAEQSLEDADDRACETTVNQRASTAVAGFSFV
ncbi:hypothetical protein BIFDEN_01960 [Bifidobacterium dentium ATCC 27678]|nr:hypothetical protein BIFDEN_01960 [Bifidobacterium dentium ATCC 27678]